MNKKLPVASPLGIKNSDNNDVRATILAKVFPLNNLIKKRRPSPKRRLNKITPHIPPSVKTSKIKEEPQPCPCK